MDEWIAKIEELWGHYSNAEYAAVLDAGNRMVSEAPAPFTTLLYIALADCVLQLDQVDQAVEYMKKAREHFTSESFIVDEPTLVTKENVPYLYRGELTKCRQNLVLSNFPESYLVQSHLAHCSYWLGDFEEALSQYQDALRLCLNNENLQEEVHICRLGQARCHAQLGDLQTAEALLLEIYPHERNRLDQSAPEIIVAAAGFLACVKAWQGRVPEGRLIFQTDLSPDAFPHPYKRSSCHAHRGIVRFIAASIEGAKEDFQAVAGAPIRNFDKLEAFLYLGDISTMEGDMAQARLWYEKAALFPEVFLGKKARFSLEQSTPEPVAKEVAQPLAVPSPQAGAEDIASAAGPGAPLTDEQAGAEDIASAAEPDVSLTEAEASEIWSELPLTAILLGLETLDLKKS